jgi:hypothetical protein
MLEMSTADFGNSLKITSDNGMVTFLAELQEIVEKIRTDNGFAGAPPERGTATSNSGEEDDAGDFRLP